MQALAPDGADLWPLCAISWSALGVNKLNSGQLFMGERCLIVVSENGVIL
jgi:hypothetical protein